ncbi:MAG: acyl-CoA thioesterase [Pseudomonadales bacterium]|nr:acyl-CoA thioesterase [Pseudomonadales bacterium]
MDIDDNEPKPSGELALRTYALPKDTNAHGNIYAGWIVSQMDLAASVAGEKATQSRVVTVDIAQMDFVSPVKVGSVIDIYATITETGRTSLKIQVEVWAHKYDETDFHKVTDAQFVVVSVDQQGRAQSIKQN